jgi:glycosyltransferase involved in cell wall biosynthesis
MGKLCIIGVDDHQVLKDFIRAHVEYLEGEKVCLDHWYPDYTHNGKTIRAYYRKYPLLSKCKSLLPQFLYQRWVAPLALSERIIHDSLEAFFRRHEVDVILAEFGPAGAEIWPHAEKLGIPLIVHFHGHDAHRSETVGPLREKYRGMFRSAFRIISVSRYMTEALVALGCDPAKIVTNPYGPRDLFFEVRPDYRPTLLALGRFTDIKANYLTLMAFKQVRESCPDARLVMVGDGELLECCKTLAQAWGIADHVTFTGAIPHAEILPLFGQACCFVQHSVSPSYGDAEGTPVAILEAQAAGLPVVATRHAGIADAVLHGQTGFLIAERDVDGMAQHMLQLIRDPALCRSMGANARKHILDHYSMQRHVACLQGVVDGARSVVCQAWCNGCL